MIIVIEKDGKGNCMNICPALNHAKVGSWYCLKMCGHFLGVTVENKKDCVNCSYEIKNKQEYKMSNNLIKKFEEETGMSKQQLKEIWKIATSLTARRT